MKSTRITNGTMDKSPNSYKSEFSDLSGVESEAYSDKMKYRKKAALSDMRNEAVKKGNKNLHPFHSSRSLS